MWYKSAIGKAMNGRRVNKYSLKIFHVFMRYVRGIPGRLDQAITNTFFLVQVCYGWPQKKDMPIFRFFWKFL